MMISWVPFPRTIAFISLCFSVKVILPTESSHNGLNSSPIRLYNSNEYIAAVVEYKPIPIGNQTPTAALAGNTNEYIQLIKSARMQDADIIVFPEYGLTTIEMPPRREQAREYFVDVPDMGATPCTNDAHSHSKNFDVLYALSCSAREHQIYVIVNLGEVDYCESSNAECPNDGAFHYNTNIVFDRQGSIIARYRKFHLYFEPQFDYPLLEYSSFQTDFGVEFGLLTCFDIIFANPAVKMIVSKGIRNFVFPTAWVDELPFLTAIQTQSLWAQSNKANLLASGYHQPERGSMGSGIYSGERYGALEYVFDPSSGTKLIVSHVPVVPEGNFSGIEHRKHHEAGVKDQGVRHFWLREDLSNYSYKTLDRMAKKDLICHEGGVCCHFEYELSSTTVGPGEMKIIAFDGRRTVAAKRDWFDWQVCAVVTCLNSTMESCTENHGTNKPLLLPTLSRLSIKMTAVKIEYETGVASQPALSLLDTSFNLISQQDFTIVHDTDNASNLPFTNATVKMSSNIDNVEIKTIALIQKIYAGRL